MASAADPNRIDKKWTISDIARLVSFNAPGRCDECAIGSIDADLVLHCF